MLTAVPDIDAPVEWVQVLGRIAVHLDGEEPRRLTGSAQRLLSVLVAAGRDGATAERIAEEIWGDSQPNPWRPALRMAVARLRKQLPESWDVVADGGEYRILVAPSGWIDAWRLDEVASAKREVSESDLGWMLAGSPFGDIDLLEMVGSSTQHLRMLQITVAERFCMPGPPEVSTLTCGVLTSLVRDHPYNDRLAVVVGRALAGAGRRTEALVSLTAFADSYVSEFGDVPTELAEFLASGGGQADTSPALDPDGGPTLAAMVPPVELAKELRHLADGVLLGRAREVQALVASTGALLTGPVGSGKSRLLAAVITEDQAVQTTYVVGDDRLDLALGPFAVAMPDLRNELIASAEEGSEHATLDDGSAARAASTRAWRIVLAHLEMLSVTRPQRLVVDDAHLLDGASLGLLRLLIRSNTAADLTIIVSGRSDFDDADWTDFVRDAERAGLDPVQLNGLNIDELDQMVYQAFPNATREARHGLTVDVFEASGGLPAVAQPLIAAADPATLALPEQLAGTSALARVTATLSERAPEVVAAAAVLGHQFSIGALIALTGLDEAAIFDALDELWSTGLVVETDDPDQVRFRHVLIQRAFLDGIPLFRRSQLHRLASELATDLHERADHHADAGALITPEIAAASLTESAFAYAKNRQWRKAARQLRRADELPGDHLGAASLALWAAALDRSGSAGDEPRQSAYALAADAGEWESALSAALSGWPEAERISGDPERIKMLNGIPDEGLPTHMRFDRVFHLSRQYALTGDHAQAMRFADLALALAVEPDEISLSHVCRWTATRHVEPQPYAFPADVIDAGSIGARLRIAQMNALSAAERGDYVVATSEAARFDALAGEFGDPLRIWQSMNLKAMFQLNGGDFARAESLAVAALEYAELHGLTQAGPVFVAQRLHVLMVQGRLAEATAVFESFRPNLSTSILGRAVLNLIESAAHGKVRDDEVRSLAQDAVERQNAYSPVVLVYLSSLLVDHAPDLVPAVRAVLSRFGDRPLIVGFGAADFGPTVLHVAKLSTSDQEKRALITQAVAAADRHDQPVWRVLARLDGAEQGIAHMLAEAEQLAEGTPLTDVIERRRASFDS